MLTDFIALYSSPLMIKIETFNVIIIIILIKTLNLVRYLASCDLVVVISHDYTVTVSPKLGTIVGGL